MVSGADVDQLRRMSHHADSKGESNLGLAGWLADGIAGRQAGRPAHPSDSLVGRSVGRSAGSVLISKLGRGCTELGEWPKLNARRLGATDGRTDANFGAIGYIRSGRRRAAPNALI